MTRREEMRRLKRFWQQSTTNKIIIIVLIALPVVAIGGYSASWLFSWTGFGDYTKLAGIDERGKTLWDWLQLLIIPVVLATGAWWLQRTEHKIEREVADQRAQEATLQAYLDRMTELLLEKELRTSGKDDEVRAVARARTLTALRQLDGERKGTLLRFLVDADLINKDNTIVSLSDAELEGAHLRQADLKCANLSQVNLSGADLKLAWLFNADLMRVSLSGADLSQAALVKASLLWADLSEANLMQANLSDTHLYGANLSGANLSEAHLFDAHLGMVQFVQVVPANKNQAGPAHRLDVDGANLSNANLSGAYLWRAHLVGVNLTEAKLTRADLREANFSGVNLEGADLREANLSNITYDDQTVWPKGFILPADAIKIEE